MVPSTTTQLPVVTPAPTDPSMFNLAANKIMYDVNETLFVVTGNKAFQDQANGCLANMQNNTNFGTQAGQMVEQIADQVFMNTLLNK